MKLPIKKGWVIAIFIFFILIILNPTRRDFMEFLGKPLGHNGNHLSRRANLLIFSIYHDENNYKTYLAIFKNFIKIKEE
ncbi:MAG TPA: hypothetical protein PKD42_13230 [Chitinophagaceae bacterium]|nr:hypothetical protein [Chitinophagaceae bacterium]